MLKPLSLVLRAVALGALACATPLCAKVVEQGETSFVTRDTVTVKATPYETWKALIVPGNWWSDSHTWSGDSANMYISAQAGGCFCELLPMPADAPDGVRRGSAHHMTVVLADPPKALRMRGGLGPLQSEPVDGVLTITLRPGGTGTIITFEYVVGGYMRFKTGEIATAVDAVMSQQLAGLAKLLGPVSAKGATDKGDDAAEPVSGKTSETGPAEVEKKTPSVEDAFGDLDQAPGR